MKFVMIAAVMVNVVVLSGCGGGSGGSNPPPVQADVDNQGNCSPALMADISRLSAVQTQQGLQGVQGYQAPGTYGLTQTTTSVNPQLSQNQQQVAACDTFFARHAATVSCKVPAVAANPQTTQMVMPPGTTLRTSDLKQQCDIQRTAYAQQLNTQNPNQVQNAGQQVVQNQGQVNSQAGVIPSGNVNGMTQTVPVQNQIITANSVSSNGQTSDGSQKKKRTSRKIIKDDSTPVVSTTSVQNGSPVCTTPVTSESVTALSSLKPCELIVNVGDTDQIFTAYTQDSFISQGTLKRQCDVSSKEDTCSLISTDGRGSQITRGEAMVVASKNEISLGHGKTQLVLTFAGKSLGIKCVKNGTTGFTKEDLSRILGEQLFTVNVLRVN